MLALTFANVVHIHADLLPQQLKHHNCLTWTVQEIDRVTEALDEDCRSSAGLRSNCTYER